MVGSNGYYCAKIIILTSKMYKLYSNDENVLNLCINYCFIKSPMMMIFFDDVNESSKKHESLYYEVLT